MNFTELYFCANKPNVCIVDLKKTSSNFLFDRGWISAHDWFQCFRSKSPRTDSGTALRLKASHSIWLFSTIPGAAVAHRCSQTAEGRESPGVYEIYSVHGSDYNGRGMPEWSPSRALRSLPTEWRAHTRTHTELNALTMCLGLACLSLQAPLTLPFASLSPL